MLTETSACLEHTVIAFLVLPVVCSHVGKVEIAIVLGRKGEFWRIAVDGDDDGAGELLRCFGGVRGLYRCRVDDNGQRRANSDAGSD